MGSKGPPCRLQAATCPGQLTHRHILQGTGASSLIPKQLGARLVSPGARDRGRDCGLLTTGGAVSEGQHGDLAYTSSQ